MERREAKIARTQKTFKNKWKSNDFCVLGPSWEASWGVLEASWAVWGPSWASRGDLSSALGPPGSSGRPPGAALGRFGALVGERTIPEAHAEHPESAQERPGAPGNPGVRPLKKLQPWLLAVAAAAQQHSCEPWGTPLRARGTVADYLTQP